MAQVALRKVVKMFDKTPAVQGIDLDINDREFVVLVGQSGCGKTTTLRMVAGLEEASSGEIFIGDQLVNDVPPKDRDIAMVFQNYALYPHMTVFENMSFGLRLRKFPKVEIKERVVKLCAAGQIAINLRGLDLLQARPGEPYDDAWGRMKGKIGSGTTLESVYAELGQPVRTQTSDPAAPGREDRVLVTFPGPGEQSFIAYRDAGIWVNATRGVVDWVFRIWKW